MRNFRVTKLKKFISLCDEQKIILLIDYVYGNMKWDSKSQAEVLQSAITEVVNGLSRTTHQILKSES